MRRADVDRGSFMSPEEMLKLLGCICIHCNGTRGLFAAASKQSENAALVLVIERPQALGRKSWSHPSPGLMTQLALTATSSERSAVYVDEMNTMANKWTAL